MQEIRPRTIERQGNDPDDRDDRRPRDYGNSDPRERPVSPDPDGSGGRARSDSIDWIGGSGGGDEGPWFNG